MRRSPSERNARRRSVNSLLRLRPPREQWCRTVRQHRRRQFSPVLFSSFYSVSPREPREPPTRLRFDDSPFQFQFRPMCSRSATESSGNHRRKEKKRKGTCGASETEGGGGPSVLEAGRPAPFPEALTPTAPWWRPRVGVGVGVGVAVRTAGEPEQGNSTEGGRLACVPSTATRARARARVIQGAPRRRRSRSRSRRPALHLHGHRGGPIPTQWVSTVSHSRTVEWNDRDGESRVATGNGIGVGMCSHHPTLATAAPSKQGSCPRAHGMGGAKGGGGRPFARSFSVVRLSHPCGRPEPDHSCALQTTRNALSVCVCVRARARVCWSIRAPSHVLRDCASQ